MVKIKKAYEIKKIDYRNKFAFCDYCHGKFDKCNTECNGFGHMDISFGYGSKFDSDQYELHICDKCFIEHILPLLGKEAKKSTNITSIKELNKFGGNNASVETEEYNKQIVARIL